MSFINYYQSSYVTTEPLRGDIDLSMTASDSFDVYVYSLNLSRGVIIN